MLSSVDRDRAPRSIGMRSKTSHSTPAAEMRAVAQLCWGFVRLPLVGLLLVFEPVVTTGFICLAVAGVISSLVFRSSGVTPHFPFWGVLAAAAGCGLVPLAYQRLICSLSR
jgi:hypothetical protein